MMNKRRHRIAFTVASLGVTAGLMILALPLVGQVGADIDNTALLEMGMQPEMPVPHVMRYGAIAYAPNGAWGRSQGYSVKATAEQVALQNCGDKDCRVIISFNLCGAVASDGSSLQGGTGLTRAAAEADALNRLGGGQIVNWVCN
jgi:hypothetical protein